MTNDQLKTALRIAAERLDELDRLTAIIADVCGAAEDVLRLSPHPVYKDGRSELADAQRQLSWKLSSAYLAGIKPAGE